MIGKAFPRGALDLGRLPGVPAFERSSRRAVPGFTSDFIDTRMNAPGRGWGRGDETRFDVRWIAISDAVADLIFADAAGSVVGMHEARAMTRAAPRSTVALIGAARAIGGAVANERLRDAAVLGFAKEASSTPQLLESVVDGILVKAREAARDAEAAAFVLVGFVLAVRFAVASWTGESLGEEEEE